MKYFIWSLVLLLLVLHQDYWQWDNDSLVLGFLPYTLVYHAAISIASAVVWLLAVQLCWPRRLEDPRVEEVVDVRPADQRAGAGDS